MKFVRLPLLLLAALCLAAPAARAATPDERLIGAWQEYEPSDNVIEFFANHTVKLYLTQEEGEESDNHYIGGTWSIKSRGNRYTISMHLTANGNSMDRDVTLVFDEDEMVLIDDDNEETRHRRLKGKLPAKYVW